MSSLTAILQFICPDRPGLVSELSGWVTDNGGNIIHADHHNDSGAGIFLSRIEWDMKGFKLKRDTLYKVVDTLAKNLKGIAHLNFSDERPRVAIFVSKQSHCLLDLLWRSRSGELSMDVPLVISNHNNLEEVCKDFDVDFFHVPDQINERKEETILKYLRKYNIELVVLAKYMQILSPYFLREFPSVINIHHSFLPAFKGSQPYHRAWDRGVKIIGATAHYVTEDLDDGPIIEQTISHISHRDQVEDLIRKGRDIERIALARAITFYLRRQVIVYRGRTAVFA